MRVGSKGRYAVVALVDVATHATSGPVPLADVAARQKISLSYLEQLFAMLRRANLVVSARGPGGGYRLERPARDISVGEIFRAVDETSDGGEAGTRLDGATSGLWSALDSHISAYLEGVSVADVIEGRVDGGLKGQLDGKSAPRQAAALS